MSDGENKEGVSDSLDTSVGFEDGMEALEKLVARLESGDLPLEEALREFEHGVGLVRVLNDRLNAAERRIEILTRADDGSLQVEVAEEDDP